MRLLPANRTPKNSFKALTDMLVGMAIVLTVGMLADLLLIQAGIDGIGRFESIQVTVSSIERTETPQRLTRSRSAMEPAFRYTFRYVVEGRPAASNRVFLLGSSLDVPQRLVESNPAIAALRAGQEIGAYYVPSTDTVFIEVGFAHALEFWVRAFAVFGAFILLAGVVPAAVLGALQKMRSRK